MPSEAKLCPVCGKEHSPFCCPFCGGEAIVRRDSPKGGVVYVAGCFDINCDISVYVEAGTEEGAAELWNTRASRATPDIDKAVEEIAVNGVSELTKLVRKWCKGTTKAEEDAAHVTLGAAIVTIAEVRDKFLNLAPAESDTESKEEL